MLLSHPEEIALINAWIAEHRVTLCPSRFAVRLDALSVTELTRRLAAFTPRARPPSKEDARGRWRELLHLSATAPTLTEVTSCG